MKIFISHSSKDKWAARRISDDLINSGATTFVDEKDIQTGESIDQSIKKHLKECDDFIIIISPASIKSEWVLLELGGAIALEKNIIPIMLYVGVNEIPQIINLKLARDINDVGLYYQEIVGKIKSKKVPLNNKVRSKKSISKIKGIKPKYQIGQAVKIISYRPENVFKGRLLVDWEEEMNDFMGKETKITGSSNYGTYYLEIDKFGRGGGFVWAEEWLIPIN